MASTLHAGDVSMGHSIVSLQPIMNEVTLHDVQNWGDARQVLLEQLEEMSLEEMLTHSDEMVRKYARLILIKAVEVQL